MQLKVGDVLPRLLPCYRSVDLRCAVGFQVDSWLNLHTVIRFTHQNTSEVKRLYANLARTLPVVETTSFKIICKAFPLSKWNIIKEQISLGYLTLDDFKFKISSTDVDALPCLIAKNPLHVISEGWNVAEAVSKYATVSFEKYESELLKMGYQTTYNALNSWLHTKLTTPIAPEIVMAAPVYAKILRSDYRTERALRVIVERSASLGNLNLMVEVVRQNSEQEGLQETIQLHSTILKSAKKREAEVFDLRVPTSLRADRIKVSLVSSQPTPLTLDWGDVMVQSKQASPSTRTLLALFNRLRDVGHIQDYLVKKGVVRVDAFYNAVIWMLSLCSLCVIYLGDTVRKRRGYIRHIEIIGSDQLSNTLILGVGARSEAQIDKCINMLEKIRDSLSDDLGLETQVTPLLFFRHIAPEASKKIAASRGVILLDSLELNKIADLLKSDNIREARRRLGVYTASRSLT
jgi:hypothetical protein